MPNLPPVTVRTLTRAVFLRKWGWIVTAVWGFVGVLEYVNGHKDKLPPRIKVGLGALYVLPSFG